jgi:short-subunit dehydrogenase
MERDFLFMQISNKNIILTGAASGIGRALLNLLVDFDNVQILAVDRQIGVNNDKTHWFRADLSQKQEVDKVFAEATRLFGSIDICIANAGFAYYETIQSTDYEHIEQIFRVNTLTPIYMLEKMKELNPNRESLTVMTASAMAKLGIPGYALYGATKAALDRFADAYWYENQEYCRLMLIYPIATKTNFFKTSVNQKSKLPVTPFPSHTPEFVAKCIINGILKDKKQVFPSLLNSITRLPQWLYEVIHIPYQWFYANELKKWTKK